MPSSATTRYEVPMYLQTTHGHHPTSKWAGSYRPAEKGKKSAVEVQIDSLRRRALCDCDFSISANRQNPIPSVELFKGLPICRRHARLCKRLPPPRAQDQGFLTLSFHSDSRIPSLIRNGLQEKKRSFFVVVGDHSKDVIVHLHYIMASMDIKQNKSVLWAYKN
ncbi:hypothetical protein IMZ48_05870, partial [Candidatus Bathyarchaeota archaeon]|nr:hypothetical protein [Candidatus Bathyarchaeota archaeon]